MAQILGTSLDDELTSTAEDDAIWGGTGGVDTAVFSGIFSDYSISDNGDGSYYVTDLRAGANDGRDKVRSIETFTFSDRSVSLETFIGEAAPIYTGTSGADTLLGGAGDDTFAASAGNDAIWGGTGGSDTLIYGGALADYTITLSDNGAYYVSDLRAGQPDGVDKLRSIETFVFSDRQVSLEEFVALSTDPAETVTGTDGADNLIGGGGDDVLIPLAGQDRVWGGRDGNDTVILDGNFDDYLVTDNANGALTLVDLREDGFAGIKVIRDIENFVFADQEVALADIFGGAPTVEARIVQELRGTDGADRIAAAHTGGVRDAYTNERLIGGGGEDRLRGGAGDDELHGDHVAGAAAFEDSPETTLTPFAADDSFYQVIDGQILRFDLATMSYEAIGERHAEFNAVGLNPLDGFAYGIGAEGAFEGHLLRFGADGAVEDLGGDFSGPGRGNGPPTAGAFSPDGTYYVLGHANRLLAIDVRTGDVTEIRMNGETPHVVDIAFIGIDAFGVGQRGELYRYDVTTGDVTKTDTDGLLARGTFDSVWADGQGALYAAQSESGQLYRIADVTAGTPVLEAVAQGESASASDGFSFGDSVALAAGGRDLLFGGHGNDRLHGGEGNDRLSGGTGADLHDGGEGRDTADYSRADAAVSASLVTGGTAGEAAGDSFVAVENLKGSRHDDVLEGDDARNFLSGFVGNDVIRAGGGNDVIRGGTGADIIDGGEGFDTLSYRGAGRGVTVDLGLGIGTGGEASGDSFAGIEQVLGSDHGDVIITAGWINHVAAGGGDDLIVGNAGGGNRLWGGAGFDTVSYSADAFQFDFTRVEDQRAASNPRFDDLYTYEVTNRLTGDTDFLRDVERVAFDNGYFDTATGEFFATPIIEDVM